MKKIFGKNKYLVCRGEEKGGKHLVCRGGGEQKRRLKKEEDILLRGGEGRWRRQIFGEG